MKTDDLITCLKEIVETHEQFNSSDSPFQKEIQMWREYFLRKEMKPFSEARKGYVKERFMSNTSKEMMSIAPIQYLKLLEKDSETKANEE